MEMYGSGLSLKSGIPYRIGYCVPQALQPYDAASRRTPDPQRGQASIESSEVVAGRTSVYCTNVEMLRAGSSTVNASPEISTRPMVAICSVDEVRTSVTDPAPEIPFSETRARTATSRSFITTIVARPSRRKADAFTAPADDVAAMRFAPGRTYFEN